MASYLVYTLNPAGRIVNGTDANCANDAEAVAWAMKTTGDGAPAEIWQGARLVGRAVIKPPGVAGRCAPVATG